MRYDTAQNMNSCFTVRTPGVSYNMMCIDYKQYCSFPVYILSIWFRCWRLETLTYFGLLCYFHAHKTENKEISTGPPCMKSDYRLVSTWYILYTRHLVTFTSMSAMGGAVSGSLAGTAVAYIMSLVGWKSAGVAERYVGATPLTTERNASGSHEQAYMDANDLPTLPDFAKRYAASPRVDP